MKEKLSLLKDKLSNISKANRAVKLTKIPAKWGFDLYVLNHLKDTKSACPNDMLKWLVGNKEELLLINNESNEEEALAICGSLSNLNKNLKFIEGETGQYNLCIGYPFLKGYTNDGNYLQAPILLYPVRLEKNKGNKSGWSIIKVEDGFVINKALFLAIKKANEKNIDEQELDDNIEINLKQFDNYILSLMEQYNINADFKNEKIVPFDSYKKDEYPLIANNTFEIAKYMVLGSFSLSDSSISKDYSELLKLCDADTELGLIEDIMVENEMSFLEEDRLKDYKDVDDIEEKEKFYITDVDASQEEVIIASEVEKGLVVDGPPGTGKSQVIANLISNHLAKGEKVLVVCQKRVALDVVFKKLEEAGLNEYCALVNDTKEDKKVLYSKIAKLIENSYSNEEHIKAKNAYDGLSRRIKNTTDYFNRIQRELNTKQQFGLSAGELYSNSKKTDQNIEMLSPTVLSYQINSEFLNEFRHKIKFLGDYHSKFGDKHHPLYYRKSFSEIDNKKIYELWEIISDLISEYEGFSNFKSSSYPKILLKESVHIQKSLEVLIAKLENHRNCNLDRLRFLLWKLTKGKNISNLLLKGSLISSLKLDELKNESNSLKRFNEYLQKLCKINDMIKIPHMKEEYIDKLRDKIEVGEDITELLECLLVSLKEEADYIIEMDNLISKLEGVEKELYNALAKLKRNNEVTELGTYWQNCLNASLYLKWIDECEKKYPDLRCVSTGMYEKLLAEYKTLIEEKKNLSPLYLKLKLAERAYGVRTNLPQNQINRLLREVTAKRAKPVRKIVGQHKTNGLLDFMPVWLVSPETVSNIFPLQKNLFDLVIFDEASQCNVEDAIPTLFRAKRVVVAGDEKQLPPCNIGKVLVADDDEDEDNEDLIRDAESLLDLCKRRFTRRPLCWHYRSKNEELINFSNHAFYGGNIQIAPNIQFSEVEKAISWVRVPNGVWRNNINEIEAQKVVEILKNTMVNYRGKSIGIIAFNKKQADRIDKLIEQKLSEDLEFGALYNDVMANDLERRIFVKNIENVQGDERQIIIFSVTYGRGENGRVSGRYGDLNNDGGENKLNVAITRATENIIVVSSIEPHEIDVSSCKNQGPYFFKKYLEYAQAVSDGNKERVKLILNEVNSEMNVENKKELEFDSIFEEEVYDRLTKKGYVIETQVGCSGYKIDQAVIHPDIPGRYILGIECDGATYHSARSAKERDVYRQKFLESKGWKIIRVWSRNWWANPEREFEKVDNKVKELIGQTC